MRSKIEWRNTTSRGLAAWGNETLNQRVLDLLADIMFASEEIRDMVAAEHGFEPFPGFERELASIYSSAWHVMYRLGPSEND